MPTYVHNIGDPVAAQLYIYDQADAYVYLDFIMYGDYGTTVLLPWSYTVNGQFQGWRNTAVQSGGYFQRLGGFHVGKSQTVIVHLGESDLGDAQDFSFYASRGDVLGVARVTVGVEPRRALIYVKDNGVWKLTEPYTKHAGVWKQST